MNENEHRPAEPPPALSAGAVLRRARERAGLHIGALAVSLKVPVHRLEALETDRHDRMPDPVFVRALALSVCRSLRIDPQTVLPLLPDAAQPRLDVEGSLNQPFRSGARSVASARWSLPGPAVLAGLVLVVAALAVFFWPESPANETTQAAAPAAPQPSPGPAMVVEPVRAAQAAPAAAAVPSATAAGGAAGPAAPAADPGGSGASALPAALLTFKASKPTWVEVIDGGGTAVLRRTLAEAEEVSISAAPVLRVAVGNAGGVVVTVRGSPFDLAAVTQGNVARFEVK